MGPTGRPAVSVRNDSYTLCYTPAEHISVYKEFVWQAPQVTAFPLCVITFSMPAFHIHQL